MKLSDLIRICSKIQEKHPNKDVEVFIRNKCFDTECNENGYYHLDILKVSIDEDHYDGKHNPKKIAIVIDQE